MLLKKIIRTSSKNIGQINILDLSLDSRKVKKGCLFFALKGSKTDGEKFIKEAIQKGAVVIVCSFKSRFTHSSIPIIKVQNIEISNTTFAKQVENFFELTASDTSPITPQVISEKCLDILDDIINESDFLLIDRGDLSKEIPIEKIPFTQKI